MLIGAVGRVVVIVAGKASAQRLLPRDECVSALGARPEDGFAACFLTTRCPPALPAGAGEFPRCFGNAPDTCSAADWLAQGLARTSAELGEVSSGEAVVRAEVLNGSMAVLFDGCFADSNDRERSITHLMQKHSSGTHSVSSCAAVCAPSQILALKDGECHCGDVLLTPVGSRAPTAKCGHGCRAEQARDPAGEADGGVGAEDEDLAGAEPEGSDLGAAAVGADDNGAEVDEDDVTLMADATDAGAHGSE